MAISSIKALTGLRIAVGILFGIFGEYKIFGVRFTIGGGYQYWIGSIAFFRTAPIRLWFLFSRTSFYPCYANGNRRQCSSKSVFSPTHRSRSLEPRPRRRSLTQPCPDLSRRFGREFHSHFVYWRRACIAVPRSNCRPTTGPASSITRLQELCRETTATRTPGRQFPFRSNPFALSCARRGATLYLLR
jgi:hypothetical protein